jgi:hypothetical protein
MSFDETELNYLLEALIHFNETKVPRISSFDRAVYIAEIEGLMEKIGHHLDGEDEPETIENQD